jgi:DNA-binding transcriptional regulator YhcF (GntR family)
MQKIVKKLNGMEDFSGPLYQKIRKCLEELIIDGELPDKYRLPADRELAAMLGVNHITLAKSLGELRNQGLLERRRGSGTFVRSPVNREELAPGNRSKLVAVIFDDVNPATFQSELFICLHNNLKKHGLEMLFLSSSYQQDIQFEQIRGLLRQPNCCGCLVWSILGENQVRELMKIKPSDFPLIFMDKYYEDSAHDAVVYDGFSAAKELGDAFIKRGWEKIVFLVSRHRFSFKSISIRYDGLRSALGKKYLPQENLKIYLYDSETGIDAEKLSGMCKDAVLVSAYMDHIVDLHKALVNTEHTMSEFYPCAAFGPLSTLLPGENFNDIIKLSFDVPEFAKEAVELLIKRLNGDGGDWKVIKIKGRIENSCNIVKPFHDKVEKVIQYQY